MTPSLLAIALHAAAEAVRLHTLVLPLGLHASAAQSEGPPPRRDHPARRAGRLHRGRGRAPAVRGRHGRGSIPACAGEPHGRTSASVGFGVYPRVCGGTVVSLHRNHGKKGLSPRVRGNRTQ